MKDNSIDDLRRALYIQISVCKSVVQMIMDRFIYSGRELNEQGYALFQLYLEEIEIAESVSCLLENNMSFGIDTLCRSFVERYIYFNAVLKDINMARSYLLSSIIESMKSSSFKGKYHGLKSYVPEEWLRLAEQNKNSKQETIDKLNHLYESLFSDLKTKQTWYSLDGKTNTIEKLVKKLELREFESYVYSLLSQELHGRKITHSAEEVLYTRTYPIKKEYDNLSNIVLVTGYLIQFRILINNYFHLSIDKTKS
jgi:hypothetical protein